MGLFLTLLFILTAYLGPETLWGPIYEFHIEIILAFLATVTSLHGLQRSKIFSIPQTYALVGMCSAVFLSMLMAGWLGGIPAAIFNFVPNAFTFVLVVINCRTRKHLQMFAAVLLIASVFTIARGYMALHAGDYLSPYLIGQGNDEGESIYRLRGLAFINDPNDFAQLMVSLIPCMFFFWRKGSTPRNLFLVLVPVAILVFGMYLTHSRGGMIALLAVVLFAFRRKIGTIPAAIIAGGLFALTSVLGWSGGRDVSVEAGSGRMEAWAEGIDLLKSHPLFGVGFQRFSEYFFITAHNTVVVCAAELGMYGLFWWVMFILPTIRDATVSTAGKSEKAEDEEALPYESMAYSARREPVAELRWQPAGYPGGANADAMVGAANSSRMSLEEQAEVPLYLQTEQEEERLPPEEIQRLASLMLISLVGYFVAGWFLSRAYVMTLFIYGGLVQAVYRMALDQDLAPSRMKVPKIVQYSAMWSVGLIIVVYLMLRIQHLLGIQ